MLTICYQELRETWESKKPTQQLKRPDPDTGLCSKLSDAKEIESASNEMKTNMKCCVILLAITQTAFFHF